MRRLLLAVVWAYAAWVWTSMTHVFLGVPDVGALVGLAVAVAILLRPMLAMNVRTRDPNPKAAATKVAH